MFYSLPEAVRKEFRKCLGNRRTIEMDELDLLEIHMKASHDMKHFDANPDAQDEHGMTIYVDELGQSSNKQIKQLCNEILEERA